MKVFFAIGYMEICLDSVGAKIDYIRYKSDNVLDNFRICVPNYGVDKTFRYPKDGFFISENYEVVSKSDDMCVFRCKVENIESFVMYQLTKDSILVHVTVSNDSDVDLKVNPAIVYDFNIPVSVSGNSVSGSLNSEKSFVINDVSRVSGNSVVIFKDILGDKRSGFVLKSKDKTSIQSKIRLV